MSKVVRWYELSVSVLFAKADLCEGVCEECEDRGLNVKIKSFLMLRQMLK